MLVLEKKYSFENIVDTLYSLGIEQKEEIKTLLEYNIAEERRSEIISNYKSSLQDYKKGKLKFSGKISELKNLL